jgi:hypothetical protein
LLCWLSSKRISPTSRWRWYLFIQVAEITSYPLRGVVQLTPTSLNGIAFHSGYQESWWFESTPRHSQSVVRDFLFDRTRKWGWIGIRSTR